MSLVEPGRVELALLPTPLVRLSRLSRELGAEVWLKRDDLTGLEVSGNKVRKLEYVVADALARGCDTIVTEGTCQSNHCRATAAVCAKLGLHAVLLFRPEPDGAPAGNHLLDVMFGAEVRGYPRPWFDENREAVVAEVLAELESAGRRPRWTPAGASEPLGCWGYIRAMGELAAQVRGAGIGSCDVVVPVSSGGTFGGMVLGKKVHEADDLEVWGVPVSDDVVYHVGAIGALTREASEAFGLGVAVADEDLRFVDGFVGAGYGIPYPEANEAIRLLARLEAVMLDPVYTAKGFCGLLDGIAKGRFGKDRPVVFVHTGGIFSDFAWPERVLG